MANQMIVPSVNEPESLRHMQSTLIQMLHTVFGKSWIGQRHFTTTSQIDALHAALQLGPGAHVLELGSGMGGPAIYLAQQTGCRVTGIECSAESVRLAQRAADAAGVAGRVRFLAGDIATATFPAGAFHAIVSHDTFVTLQNKAQLFALCRQWLQPGGHMGTTLIVNRDGLADVTTPPSMLDWPIPTVDDYCALARTAGLQIVAATDLTPTFREISARWRGALMVWELALLPQLSDDEWPALRETIGQLAEWATQGRIGHMQLVLRRQSSHGEYVPGT
jgi:SAM-dependent methyltransferase